MRITARINMSGQLNFLRTFWMILEGFGRILRLLLLLPTIAGDRIVAWCRSFFCPVSTCGQSSGSSPQSSLMRSSSSSKSSEEDKWSERFLWMRSSSCVPHLSCVVGSSRLSMESPLEDELEAQSAMRFVDVVELACEDVELEMFLVCWWRRWWIAGVVPLAVAPRVLDEHPLSMETISKPDWGESRWLALTIAATCILVTLRTAYWERWRWWWVQQMGERNKRRSLCNGSRTFWRFSQDISLTMGGALPERHSKCF